MAVIDRFIFRNHEIHFLQSMILNALYPLLFALIFFVVYAGQVNTLVAWMLEPGIMLSGLGAQLAATAMSLGLRSSSVRNVIVTSKSSDLLIPLILIAISGHFSLEDLLFTQLTTLAFIPVALTVFKQREMKLPLFLLIVGSLLFQAVVNAAFQISQYARTMQDFCQLMVCVLTWRSILMLFPFFFQKKRGGRERISTRMVWILCARGGLAFLSQAAFFLAITHDRHFMAWPILNGGPLLSCYTAKWFLKEKAARSEGIACIFICLITLSYALRWI